jgi:flagellar L-ring protein FlgH
MNNVLKISMLAALLAATSLCRAGDDDSWKMANALYKDTKARNIGDILTVHITEETLASKDAKSSSSKNSSLSGSASFGHPIVDGRETAWTNASLPAYSLEANRSFQGDGSIENSEKFTASVTVRIIDILPNKNLLIEGQRSLVIQEETMKVHVSGTVRPADISRNNTINSSAIADASIKYESEGPLVKNQKRGLFTRFLNWINPF